MSNLYNNKKSLHPRLFVLLTGVILLGCQTAQHSPIPADVAALATAPAGASSLANLLVSATLFPAPRISLEADTTPFLELNDSLRAELDQRILPIQDDYERYRRLRRWVFDRFEEYDFDITVTYSVGELATHRKINCLSFSTFYMAAARYADIPAYFQLVYAPPYWDENNDTWIYNQHINVAGSVPLSDAQFEDVNVSPLPNSVVGPNSIPIRIIHQDGNAARQPRFGYVIDISPAIVSMSFRRQVLNDAQVLSLYYSNKSMQALLASDLGGAYHFTRLALQTDAESSAAWNNLGVLYGRIDQLDLAADAYRRAIFYNPDVHSARSNLAAIYRRQGETARADALDASVAVIVEQNPYYHQSLADRAMQAGDHAGAIQHLNDAVARKSNEFLFYHELAIAHQKLGHHQEVIDNLTAARRYARGAERTKFSGKLQALRQLAEAR